ncbi:MAG: hypothetical protein IJU05_08575 [Schwartzia sp.]|nr:hypothetical protein [Schwartzia sp. (in: firmicutes)]
MDVSSTTSTRAASYASYAQAASSAKPASAAKGAAPAQSVGNAYEVNISEEAKAANQTKGLNADQVNALKSDIENSHALMIQTLTQHNAKLQGWLDDGIGKLNFAGINIEASRFALPSVGTTPEEAAAAIAEGGEWSVNAVADRIFGLASAIAGGDPDKLKEMQAAVAKGFQLAGIDFQQMTGKSGMPQITQDTHDEITRRFDELYKQLGASGNTATATAKKTEL